MKTIIMSAVGLVVCLATVGSTAEVKSLQMTNTPPKVQESFQSRHELPTLHHTYPLHREEWRREGLELRAFDTPRRNLDIGRGERIKFFKDYVDR